MSEKIYFLLNKLKKVFFTSYKNKVYDLRKNKYYYLKKDMNEVENDDLKLVFSKTKYFQVQIGLRRRCNELSC